MTDFIVKALENQDMAYMISDIHQREAHHVVEITADSSPGYPCRVTLEDADIGETIYAIHYQHQSANSPYKASGPIFVRKNKPTKSLATNQLPDFLQGRLISVRCYDDKGFIVHADVVDHTQIKSTIIESFNNEDINYLHLHFAKAGCFACAVYRH